jgi:hypothetical protein
MFHQWLVYIFLQLCCESCPLWRVYVIILEDRFVFVCACQLYVPFNIQKFANSYIETNILLLKMKMFMAQCSESNTRLHYDK